MAKGDAALFNLVLRWAGDFTRITRLPRDFFWVSQFSGLIADQALPDTERLGLGGFYAVRG